MVLVAIFGRDMGKIGYGYGSEWHLLRYLGYHRQYLTSTTIHEVGCNTIDWMDFGFSVENKPLRDDSEFKGLEFIQEVSVQEKWKLFWPQTGNSQNWDAVAKIHFNDHDEWLLVEAKGHLGEVKSNCGAVSHNSTEKIISAFEKTSQAFGNRSKPVLNWLENYYQYANRLAVLYFLMKECAPPVHVRLLFIYFYGENREHAVCAQNEQGWKPLIQDMNDWLGVDQTGELAERVHHLFLSVNPLGVGARPRADCD
jgi:hypothetical protein